MNGPVRHQMDGRSRFGEVLGASFRRQKGILLHARGMFGGTEIRALDAGMIVAGLMLLTAAQKLLFAAQTRAPVTFLDVLQPLFLAVLLGWGGLSSIAYYAGRAVKRFPDFTRIVVLMGAAALPLALATLTSVLITLACLILGVKGSVATWQLVHTLIAAVGLIFGWPGYFSALAIESGGQIKRTGALLISLVLLAVLAIGFALPYIIK